MFGTSNFGGGGISTIPRRQKWWKPKDEKQQREFNMMKGDVRSLLISSKEGINVRSFYKQLTDLVESEVDYEKLGFNTFGEFLWHCDDILDVRTDGFGGHHLFLKGGKAGEEHEHLRKLVQGQARSKARYKGVRAMVSNTTWVPSQILVDLLKRPQTSNLSAPKPAPPRYRGKSSYNNFNGGRNNYVKTSVPPRFQSNTFPRSSSTSSRSYQPKDDRVVKPGLLNAVMSMLPDDDLSGDSWDEFDWSIPDKGEKKVQITKSDEDEWDEILNSKAVHKDLAASKSGFNSVVSGNASQSAAQSPSASSLRATPASSVKPASTSTISQQSAPSHSSSVAKPREPLSTSLSTCPTQKLSSLPELTPMVAQAERDLMRKESAINFQVTVRTDSTSNETAREISIPSTPKFKPNKDLDDWVDSAYNQTLDQRKTDDKENQSGRQSTNSSRKIAVPVSEKVNPFFLAKVREGPSLLRATRAPASPTFSQTSGSACDSLMADFEDKKMKPVHPQLFKQASLPERPFTAKFIGMDIYGFSFIQIMESPFVEAYAALKEDIQNFYSKEDIQEKHRLSPEHLLPGTWVIAHDKTEKVFFRARIFSRNDEKKTCTIYDLQEHEFHFVPFESLYSITEKFYRRVPQAIICILDGLEEFLLSNRIPNALSNVSLDPDGLSKVTVVKERHEVFHIPVIRIVLNTPEVDLASLLISQAETILKRGTDSLQEIRKKLSKHPTKLFLQEKKYLPDAEAV